MLEIENSIWKTLTLDPWVLSNFQGCDVEFDWDPEKQRFPSELISRL